MVSHTVLKSRPAGVEQPIDPMRVRSPVGDRLKPAADIIPFQVKRVVKIEDQAPGLHHAHPVAPDCTKIEASNRSIARPPIQDSVHAASELPSASAINQWVNGAPDRWVRG